MNGLLWKGLPSLACGLALGYGSQSALQADEPAAAAAAAHAPICNAAQAPVAIEAAPTATVRNASGRGATLRYDVTVKNGLLDRGRAGVITEILTPSYLPVVTAGASAAATVEDGASLKTQVTTPESLADGYYVVRVSGAVATSKSAERASIDLYIHVVDGEAMPIDIGEFEQDAAQNGSI